MINLMPILLLQGKGFSPLLVEEESGIRFTTKNEPNELATRGKYKNKPLPYGSAEYSISEETENIRRVAALADVLDRHVEGFRKRGAETIIFHVNVEFEGQCNIEFDPAALLKIAKHGVAFTISCWETKDGLSKAIGGPRE